jgi:UDP-N-acetylmuramate dehydrogenase
MRNVREQVMLSSCTTLGLGGPARRFVMAGTDQEIIAEVRAADQRGEPLLILGGGSNLVIADQGFPGTVLQIATRGIDWAPGPGPGAPARLTVAAGEDWDGVVAYCVAGGLAGLECLSGIPGRAGATPIQNVGAYGQEVAETITTVRVYDRARDRVLGLGPADCAFGYRTSAFKRDPGGRFVVLGVTFSLARDGLSRPVRYAELARALGRAEGEQAALGNVRDAVLALRRGKGMVLDPGDPDSRSAGSFFTNPILSAAQFAALREVIERRCGPGARIPQFPAGPGQVKISAAWLIGQAGFGRGYPGEPAAAGQITRFAGARISTKHTLALVNPGDATTDGLVALARDIRDRVLDAFGVQLAPEPVLVGVTL